MTLLSHPAPPYSYYSSPPRDPPVGASNPSSIRLGTLSPSPSWSRHEKHLMAGVPWPFLSHHYPVPPSIPETKRDSSFIEQREALCEHSLPGLASMPPNLTKKDSVSPLSQGRESCLSSVVSQQLTPHPKLSIYPANFPHQRKQESKTQTVPHPF